MYLIKENDVYKREQKVQFTSEETITFKQPVLSIYEKPAYDWYILVALEKSDEVKENRHLLTSELLLSYRWAIREGFNHQLDSALKTRFAFPRNRNTVSGIEKYIDRIKKASEAEMKELD